MVFSQELEYASNLLDGYFTYSNPDKRQPFLLQDLIAKYFLGLLKIRKGNPSGETEVNHIIDIVETILEYPDYANALDILHQRVQSLENN